MARLLLLVLVLISLSAVPFMIWGAGIEANLSLSGAADFMRGYGRWAWAAGLVLILLDIALPIPATVVMAALGIIYGPWVGGAVAATGSLGAGLAGYAACRLIGPETARRIAGEAGFAQARGLFERWGGWLVAGSRWLPVLPETVSFLAGLLAMPLPRYVAALACGAVPLGFTFATAGHFGADNVALTMVASALAPLALWLVVRPVLKRL